MAKLQFSPPITDVKEMIRNNKLNWEKSALKHYTKSSAVHFKPNRMDSTFEPDFIMPNFDIYGRAIVNKPGVYPYGSATGTTPVTSTSLKAGEYKSANANGKGVTKRKAEKIWGRYVPDEHIGMDGTPYIDLAPLTTEEDIEITFRRRDGYTQTNFLFGSNPNSGSSPVVGAWYGSSGLTVQNGSVRKIVALDTNWHTLKVTSTKTYLDGVELGNAGARTTFQNLVIGSARDERTGTVDSRCFHGDISRVKVGNKIFVAGKDVTANTFGLIDPAENKFYGNSGTGTLTAGDLIQPISYAESDGTAWADTGAEWNNTTEFEVKLTVKAQTSGTHSFWGSWNQWSTAGKALPSITTFTNYRVQTNFNAGYSSSAGTDIGISVGQTGVFSLKGDTISWSKGSSAAFNRGTSTFTISNGVTIFGCKQGTDVVAEKSAYPICYYKQWNNGTLVRDYLPVRIGTTVELLDLVNWQFATRTGTFTAGADLPYTQLCPDILETNAGDALYGLYSKNMFDKTAIKASYYLNDSGAEVYNAMWNISDYMPVIGGETYYQRLRTSGTAPRTCWYDANKNFISAVAQAAGGTQTAPANAAYCKMCVFKQTSGEADDLDYAMFTHGADAPTEYEPYRFGLHPSGEQTLVQEGKNWFGGTFNTRFTFHRPIKVGTTIYASGDDDSSQCYVRYYDADGNTITELRLSSTQQYRRMCSYTPAVDIYSCMFYNTSLNHLQIAETVAYESYITPQTLKIPTFLPSATSFLDAAKADNNVTCDWAIKVLTGTESVSYRYSDRIYPIFDIANILPDGKEAVKYGLSAECSHYEVTSWVTMVGGHDGKICVKDSDIGGNSVCIADHRFTDVQSFKAYLASEYAKGTPVIIAYPLATPAVSTLEITPVTQPLGTVTILNEFADGTKGAVDFYGVNIDIANPVPKPTEPYPLLSNVGEVIYGPGKNLFSSGLDRCTWAQNVGELVRKSDSTTRVGSADFIPVKPNTSYTLKMMGTQTFINGNWRVMLCGSDNICRQKIATSNIENTLKFTTGATEVKFAFFIAEDKTSVDGWDWMLVEGSAVPTEYEPYRFGWHGDGQQTVKMEGANIWNLGDFINGVGAQKTLEGLDTSKTYTILVKASSDYSTTGTVWSVSPRNADGTSRGNLFYMNDYVAGQTISAEFTGAAMLRIQGSNFSGSFYICVVEGSATEYIPYVTPQLRTTTEILPSATSKLNMQGGNNNEECDFNFKQLDGTETWNESSGYYYISLSGLVGAPLTAGVCTHFEYSSSQANGKFRFAGTGTANGNVVFYVTGQFATLAEWKAWLAANKPIVAYPTATTVKKTVEVTPFTIPDKMEYVASSDSELGSCDVDIICLSKSM